MSMIVSVTWRVFCYFPLIFSISIYDMSAVEIANQHRNNNWTDVSAWWLFEFHWLFDSICFFKYREMFQRQIMFVFKSKSKRYESDLFLNLIRYSISFHLCRCIHAFIVNTLWLIIRDLNVKAEINRKQLFSTLFSSSLSYSLSHGKYSFVLFHLTFESNELSFFFIEQINLTWLVHHSPLICLQMFKVN